MIESYASSEMKQAFSKALLKKLWAKDPLTANLSGLARMAAIPQAAETMHITLDGVTQSEIERVILASVDLKSSQDSDAKKFPPNLIVIWMSISQFWLKILSLKMSSLEVVSVLRSLYPSRTLVHLLYQHMPFHIR
jgi:hypothetical protein